MKSLNPNKKYKSTHSHHISHPADQFSINSQFHQWYKLWFTFAMFAKNRFDEV